MAAARPVKTYGLTHVAVSVRDLDRAARFYAQVLGAKVVYRDDGFLQMQTPGARDVLVFERDADRAGNAGGVQHFGFRLTRPGDIDRAATVVTEAGGVIQDQGEFVPGEPYLFATDLDGYTIEIWYEIPTRFDPRGRRARSTPKTRRTRKSQRAQ